MKKKLMFVIAVFAFLGVFTEVYQSSLDQGSFFGGLVLFRFYTVQSNFIVFLYFGLILLGIIKDEGWYHNLLGGVLIYIFITMSIFAIFLEAIYNPVGLYLVSSIFSHYLTPLLVVGFFVTFKKEYSFSVGLIKWWIVYPLMYMVFMVMYGMLTSDYLYPFFQVSEVGVLGLITFMSALILLFLLLSFSLVKIVSKE